MLGRRAVFGRHGRSHVAPAPILRAQADADGVARVLPQALWDDPRIGDFLREMGLGPDDPRNVLPSPNDYYRARFAEARHDLDLRIEALRCTLAVDYPACRIAPLLVVDLPIWRSRFGPLLCERLGLVAWDEWNVILLAADEATSSACGLPLHPDAIPALNVRITEALHALDARLEAKLGRASPGMATDRAQCLEIEIEARDRFLGFVAVCRDQVEVLLDDAPR